MGQLEREQERRTSNKREKAKEGRSRRAASTARVSARDLDWVAVIALVTAFSDEGGAVRIGCTRDSGAIALGCYLGDDYATEYVRPNEDFRNALLEIAEAWLPNAGIGYHQALQELEQRAKPR